MSINFPISPSLNQIYTYNNLSWLWNGVYWETYDLFILNAVTGGTYNSTTGVITLSGTGVVNGNTITGFTDYYTTGATLSNNIVYFNVVCNVQDSKVSL